MLPSVGTVRNAGSELTWSTLGLDRAGSPSLVTTEWIAAEGPSAPAVRFPLNPETMRFDDGQVTASQALTYSYPRVQGAVSHNGRWWFGTSGEGTMYYWSPSEGASAFPWVTVTEGLSYWESPDNPDVIWTVRENSGSRNSFAVRQAEYS